VNKYEDIVNLQGAEAYRGGRPPTACYSLLRQKAAQYSNTANTKIKGYLKIKHKNNRKKEKQTLK